MIFFFENLSTEKTPQISFAKLDKKIHFENFHHKKKKKKILILEI